MFSPMPRVLVQTRMGVERMLGCDLAFYSMPCQYERILVAAQGSLGGQSLLRDYQDNSSVILAMTLAHLHSRFLCVLCAFRSRCQSMLEPLSQYTFRSSWTQRVLVLCDLISSLGLETISSAWWEWAIQVPRGLVVVLFTLTIEIHLQSPWLELPCLRILLFYLVSFDGWLYFLMDVYIFHGGCFHLFYCTCIMDLRRMLYLYFIICILFQPFIPYDTCTVDD